MKWMKEQNSAVGSRLEKIRQQLQALGGRGQAGTSAPGATAKPAAGETISDDSPLPPDKAAAVQRDEALVRDALALFGIGYDSLIAMQGPDGKPTAYAQAIQANPALLAQVPSDPQPVLAALKIALGFKPYAEFAQRYGNTPDEVKAAIRSELENELKGSDAAVPVVKASAAPVFSSNRAGAARPSSRRKKGGLEDVFGR